MPQKNINAQRHSHINLHVLLVRDVVPPGLINDAVNFGPFQKLENVLSQIDSFLTARSKIFRNG